MRSISSARIGAFAAGLIALLAIATAASSEDHPASSSAVRADSAAVPRFDSTSVSIAPVSVDLGPPPGRHHRSSRWAELLGPQVVGSFPVSSFGRATSAGAGVGVQLLVLGFRPWLAIRTELGFTQQ